MRMSSEHHTEGHFQPKKFSLFGGYWCSVTLTSHPQSEGNQHCQHCGRWRQAVADDGKNSQEDCDNHTALVSDDEL